MILMTEMKLYTVDVFSESGPGRRVGYHEFYVASPTLPRKAMLLAHLRREKLIPRRVDGRDISVRVLYPWSPREGERNYDYDLVVAPRRYNGRDLVADEDEMAIFERLFGKEVVMCPVGRRMPYRRREPEVVRARAAISPKRRDERKGRRYQ